MIPIRIIKHYGRYHVGNKIDFFADRLSRVHTVSLIALFIVVTSVKRLIHDPITCWIPKELKRYERYMNKYCWLKGTYYLPIDVYGNVIDEKLYDENEAFKQQALITYYQWIPIILAFQACAFYVPYVIWTFISDNSLFDISNMVRAALRYDNIAFAKCPTVKYLASYFRLRYNHSYDYDECSDKHRETFIEKIKVRDKKRTAKEVFQTGAKNLIKKIGDRKFKITKMWLHLSFLFIKLLYLTNLIVQLIVINVFLTNATYKFDAYQLFKEMLFGDQMHESAIFPRIVQCDMKVGHEISSDRNHFYSVRCILTLNMFMEKIYVVLCIWFLIVICFTVTDLLKWLLRLIYFEKNYKYVKNLVKINNRLMNEFDKDILHSFAEDYLGHDGVFVLRLLEKNSNLLLVNELVDNLWKDYHNEINQRSNIND